MPPERLRLSSVLVLLFAAFACAVATSVATPSALDRDHALRDSQRRDSPFSPAWFPGRRVRGPHAAAQQRRPSINPSTAARVAAADVPVTAAPTSPPPAPTTSQPAEATLVQVAFMHRHGARTAPIVINGLLSWHWCHLSEEGTVMAVKLGQYVRSRYGAFLGDVYDSRRFVSRSTQYERTIRTGFGVITGVYPRTTAGNNFSIPYLYHVDMDSDKALSYYYSWGSAMLHQVELNSYNANTATQTLEYFPLKDLQMLGAIVDATPECTAASDATSCALLLEDVSTCTWSNTPNMNATLLSYLNDQYMFRAQATSLRYIYAFNASSTYWQGAGPYAMRILGDIVRQFEAALAPGAQVPPVYHYSAHDVTLFGLFVGLGAVDVSTTDYSTLVPSFTAVSFFELYSNRSVSIVYATMEQPYGTAHDYTVDPRLQLRCMTSAGTTYRASNCPLDDWSRFLATLNVSTLADPTCFAWPADVAATRCAPWGTTSIADLSNQTLSDAERALRSYCITYRQFCPATACDVNLVQPTGGLPSSVSSSDVYVLDRVNWVCRKAQLVIPASSADGRPPAGLVAAFLALGAATTVALLVVSTMECLGVHKKVDAGEGAPVEETTDLMGGEERFRSSVGRHRDHHATGAEEPFVTAKARPPGDPDLYTEDS